MLKDRWHLCELAADGASNSLGRVHVGEESLGVRLNALDVEALALVLTSSRVLNTGNETILSSLKTSDATADVLADGLRVGEGEARGTRLALRCLVDVRGRLGGRLVVALEAGQGDVVADQVGVSVDAELVQAFGAFEAAGVLVLSVDDFLGDGGDFVGRGEVEGTCLGDWEGLLGEEVEMGFVAWERGAYPHPCGGPTWDPSACQRWEWPW